MYSNVINLLNNIIQPQPKQKINTLPKVLFQENPFAVSNISMQSQRQSFYGKNNPVQGGYFAGYYNGKQNIVGRRLFVNV